MYYFCRSLLLYSLIALSATKKSCLYVIMNRQIIMMAFGNIVFLFNMTKIGFIPIIMRGLVCHGR